jgi:hypothetical protein
MPRNKAQPIEIDSQSQPHPVGVARYRFRMPKTDAKKAVAAAVARLMEWKCGRPNKTRFADDFGVGMGGAQRAVEGKIGLDVLQKIADHAHVDAWELLVPAFDPENRPVLKPPPSQALAANIELNPLEEQLVKLYRGCSQEHRDDLLALAQRWHNHANPGPSPANPFAKRKAKA